MLVFALLIAGLLIGGGWQLCTTTLERRLAAENLADHGQITAGTVTGRRAFLGTFGMTYTVRYTFQLATLDEPGRARIMSGVSQVSQPFFRGTEQNQLVPVHYDPTAPRISMLDLPYNSTGQQFWPGFICGLLFLISGTATLLLTTYAALPTPWRAKLRRTGKT